MMLFPIRAMSNVLALFLFGGTAVSAATCLDHVRIDRSQGNMITADAAKSVRRLDPSFFGFNLEWVEFQAGFWDDRNRRVNPEVIRTLQSFPGAVYRFPGGTKANHLIWTDAIGSAASRPLQAYVSWRPPLRADFGIDEYLKFVRSVSGQAWYVVNLYGGVAGPLSIDKLASDGRSLAQYMAEQAKNGLPPIIRWELGNELDRGIYKWPPSRLATTGIEVAAAIQAVDRTAKFVHLQQEYSALADAGYSADRFNRELRDAMSSLNAELALHLYYDGVPDNPSVGFFLRRLCAVVDDSKLKGGLGRVWVTEHARAPNGFWKNPTSSMWHETSDLASAVGVADMIVASAQIPEVLGTFVHSLVASGSPWPMFHRYPDGKLAPSATLLGMKLLRETMEPNVIATAQYSVGRGSEDSLYTVRGALLANDDRTRFTLWAVNRSSEPQMLVLKVSNAPASLRPFGLIRIGGKYSSIGNHLSPDAIRIESVVNGFAADGQGAWRIVLEPNSVNAASFR